MVDRLDKEHRSWNMSRIKSADTMPELIVRSVLHRMGYRFALHRKDLPGHPDIVLSMYRCIILVNGCFWHRHSRCKYAYMPKSRLGFWRKKFEENIERDKRKKRQLRTLGWKVFVVWECQIQNTHVLATRLSRLLTKPAIAPNSRRGR